MLLHSPTNGPWAAPTFAVTNPCSLFFKQEMSFFLFLEQPAWSPRGSIVPVVSWIRETRRKTSNMYPLVVSAYNVSPCVCWHGAVQERAQQAAIRSRRTSARHVAPHVQQVLPSAHSAAVSRAPARNTPRACPWASKLLSQAVGGPAGPSLLALSMRTVPFLPCRVDKSLRQGFLVSSYPSEYLKVCGKTTTRFTTETVILFLF